MRLGQDVEARAIWEREVEQQHVRLDGLDHLQRLRGGAGFANDFDVVGFAERFSERPPYDGVVLCDD